MIATGLLEVNEKISVKANSFLHPLPETGLMKDTETKGTRAGIKTDPSSKVRQVLLNSEIPFYRDRTAALADLVGLGILFL